MGKRRGEKKGPLEGVENEGRSRTYGRKEGGGGREREEEKRIKNLREKVKEENGAEWERRREEGEAEGGKQKRNSDAVKDVER